MLWQCQSFTQMTDLQRPKPVLKWTPESDCFVFYFISLNMSNHVTTSLHSVG